MLVMITDMVRSAQNRQTSGSAEPMAPDTGYTVMACIVMAYIVMAYIVIVMAYNPWLPTQAEGTERQCCDPTTETYQAITI